ncbi:MAG: hypothetical protein ACLQQ4_02130 [Bacteroidia bacterium]
MKKIFISAIGCWLLANNCIGQAQIELKSMDEWARVKNDTTYVLMDSVDNPSNDIYKKLFKDYWKASHVEFINSADFEKYLSFNSSYLSLVYPLTNMDMGLIAGKYDPDLPDNANELAMAAEEEVNLMGWKLWTVAEKYFKKQNKWSVSFVKEVAAIKMYANVGGINTAEKLSHSAPKADAKAYAIALKDAGGSICAPYSEGNGAYLFNWGPGFIKNYIQIMNQLLSSTQNGGIAVNAESIKKVKTDTLFVVDFLRGFPQSSGKYKEKDIKDLFKEYQLPYEIVSSDELNDKILNAKKDMYYLTYIHNTGAAVYVINGFTGEVVWAKKLMTDELGPDDITRIYKQVIKN